MNVLNGAQRAGARRAAQASRDATGGVARFGVCLRYAGALMPHGPQAQRTPGLTSRSGSILEGEIAAQARFLEGEIAAYLGRGIRTDGAKLRRMTAEVNSGVPSWVRPLIWATALVGLFAFRLFFGLASDLFSEDYTQVFLLGLGYYATGAWPYFGPDVTWTSSEIPGALQSLSVACRFTSLPYRKLPTSCSTSCRWGACACSRGTCASDCVTCRDGWSGAGR